MDVLIHPYVVYKWSFKYNFSTFISIYIHLVPLLFEGIRGGGSFTCYFLPIPFFSLSPIMDDRKIYFTIILNKEIHHLKHTITRDEGGPRCNGNRGVLSIIHCIKGSDYPFSLHPSSIMGQ